MELLSPDLRSKFADVTLTFSRNSGYLMVRVTKELSPPPQSTSFLSTFDMSQETFKANVF